MTTPKLHPLTEDDVRRYLVDKGTTDKCFSCGHDGWYMDGGEHNLYRCVPWGVPNEAGSPVAIAPTGSAVPVVTMTCKNCGLFRMHDAYMIVLWLHFQNSEELE